MPLQRSSARRNLHQGAGIARTITIGLVGLQRRNPRKGTPPQASRIRQGEEFAILVKLEVGVQLAASHRPVFP